MTINHYLILSSILFGIGTIGVLVRRNIIIMFMSIEIMLNAANITFMAFSQYFADVTAQVFTFLVITVAAAEACLGLAIIVMIFRMFKTVKVNELNSLKN